jgi:hypothetical protein
VGGPRSVVGVSLGTLLLALWEILLEDYIAQASGPPTLDSFTCAIALNGTPFQ